MEVWGTVVVLLGLFWPFLLLWILVALAMRLYYRGHPRPWRALQRSKA